MNNPEHAHAKSLIINYVVIILLLSLLWLLYEGVRDPSVLNIIIITRILCFIHLNINIQIPATNKCN
jgi:hypothetical protein